MTTYLRREISSAGLLISCQYLYLCKSLDMIGISKPHPCEVTCRMPYLREWMSGNLQTSHNNHDRSIIVLQGAGSDLKGYIESTLVPYLMLRAWTYPTPSFYNPRNLLGLSSVNLFYLLSCKFHPTPGNSIRVFQKPLQVRLFCPKKSSHIPVRAVEEPVYRLGDLIPNIYLLPIQICDNWASDWIV